MAKVTMTVNGTAVSHDVPDNTLLVSFLRETLKLTGTHIGCDTSQCGACVVHVKPSAAYSAFQGVIHPVRQERVCRPLPYQSSPPGLLRHPRRSL